MTSGPAEGGGRSDPEDLELFGHRLVGRTFLLGNESGFVLYLPAQQRVRDRTLMPTKWFGVSGFGRKYFEASLVYVDVDGQRTKLDRANQTSVEQTLERFVRTFKVGDVTIEQTFFMPNRVQAFLMTLEADDRAEFCVVPEFDMRYYQAFNSDFSGYGAEVCEDERGAYLLVSNRVEGVSSTVGELEFYGFVAGVDCAPQIQLIPEDRRLRHKIYLKDERREKLIEGAYAETHEPAPDEAPIWDTYDTHVYAPAQVEGPAPLNLVFAFDERPGEAQATGQRARAGLPGLKRAKADGIDRRLESGALHTGSAEDDRAYASVLTRFNEALVARDIDVYTGTHQMKGFYGIFAGNKYFLDAWKRDENISLEGLLVTNDFETVRCILDETWRFQDPRTGRLPHIIRLGEPLVYYSSDGTLWALRRLHEYTRASGDRSLLEEKYEMVEHFFSASLTFVQRGLLPSGGIIDPSYLWETWEDTPYTPRDGFPVEIELLWLTALADFLSVVRDRNPALASRLEATLAEGRDTFKLFGRDGYLADSLSYQWEPRELLTPNGYVAFALGYPLPSDLERQMVLQARGQLAGRVGVRSLAPRDWPKVLAPEFLADKRNVQGDDMASVGIYNYHRGIEWLWLNQFLVRAELQCGDAEHAYRGYVSGLVHAALHEGGMGGLSELYDLRGPLGADFQAWSMTGFLVAMHAFAGVRVDAIDRCVQVRPSVPRAWPHVRCRRRVGGSYFDVSFTPNLDGAQEVRVSPVDRAPAAHCLRLGVPVPVGKRVAEVRLDGAPVPPERWEVVSGYGESTPGEVWIETRFSGQTVAAFVMS